MTSRRTLKSLKELCRPQSLYARAKNCDVHLYAVTFWACLSFVGLGATLLVFGPTLLDFADHLGVGIDILAVMFTCRAIGGAVGSLGSGIIMDKLQNYSFSILCVIYVCCIITTVLIPLSFHVAVLGVLMALNGITTGFLDNGTHAILFKLWRDKAGPSMQILHFCFAFGAFIAPLITKQFLTERNEDFDMLSVNESISFSCEDVLNETISFDQKFDLDKFDVGNISVCSDTVQNVCYHLTGSSLLTVVENCTLIYEDNPYALIPKYAWAYWITSSFFIPSLVAFIYFAFTKDFSKCCSKCRRRKTEDSEGFTKGQNNASSTQPIWYLVVTFTLLFIFLLLYVGLEASYGSLVFTVAVKGDLDFSKSDAAVLTALFWGTFAFARLFSVFLAVCKVWSSVMMICNLSGSFLASFILVLYPHNAIAVWIGSGVLGASYASIFPSTMTWMSEHTVASAKASSILVAAGTIGNISIPSIVAVIIAKFSKDLLFYITFGGVLISSMVVAILLLETCFYNRLSKKKILNDEYTKLKEGTENGDTYN